VTASASPIRSPVASIHRVRSGRSRRDARRSASIAASHRARSSDVRARGERCPEARNRPASLVGLTEAAPYRTASPMTPDTTVRQVLAVAMPLADRTAWRKSSTLEVVTSRSRSAPIAGLTWFRHWRP
jgi:hypothetical protein